MCGNVIDMQSATAEIRQGKKKNEEQTTVVKYSVHIYYAGWP